jgi:hypothetical protein
MEARRTPCFHPQKCGQPSCDSIVNKPLLPLDLLASNGCFCNSSSSQKGKTVAVCREGTSPEEHCVLRGPAPSTLLATEEAGESSQGAQQARAPSF